jgi:hypothetical protein
MPTATFRYTAQARDLRVGRTYDFGGYGIATITARGCGGIQMHWDDGETFWVHPTSEWPIVER